jgi:hypothetical protein
MIDGILDELKQEYERAVYNAYADGRKEVIENELKEALEVIRFYANSINYSAKVDYKGLHYISIIGEKHELGEDNGKKAREFLKKLEE